MLKVPNGLYNESRDVDMLRTNILLPSAVYNEGFREIYMGLSGAGLYGSVPLGDLGDLDYQAMLGTQNIDGEDSGIAKDIENDVRYGAPTLDITDFDVNTMYVGSLQWRSPWGLRLGGTLNYLSFDADGSIAPGVTGLLEATNIRNYTASIEYTWEDLILAAEYWNLEFDRKFYITPGPPFPVDTGTTEKEGWYVSASYRVNDWFEVGSYYSVFYPDATDHDGDDLPVPPANDDEAWSKDIALSTRFDINEYWIFKMEGHRIDGKANVYLSENIGNYYNDDDKFWVFVAKITFGF